MPLHYAPDEPSLVCLDCGRAGVADDGVSAGGLALGLFATSRPWELLRGHLRARRRQRRAVMDTPLQQSAHG